MTAKSQSPWLTYQHNVSPISTNDMDSAYDAAQIHDQSKKHDRVSIIDTNPRSDKGLKEVAGKRTQSGEQRRFCPSDSSALW